MRPNLVHARALLGVVAEQSQNEVLELRGQVLPVDFLEVEVGLPGHEQVVEVLFLARLFEGEYSVDNNKKDNSEREQVHLRTFVLLALLYLGSHIRHCTAVALQAVNALVACEAEVGKLEVEHVVNEDVLKF